jgi:hypothetical protein
LTGSLLPRPTTERLDRALRLFVRFLLASALLFLVWRVMDEAYLRLLTQIVNGLFFLTDEPARFALQDGALVVNLMGFGRPLSLQLGGNHIFYLNLIVGIALFAATPAADWRWQVKWAGWVLLLTGATHLVSLWYGPELIFQDFLLSLSPTDRMQLLELGGDIWRDRAEPGLATPIFAAWRHFGRLGFVVVIWLFASRNYLRLSR